MIMSYGKDAGGVSGIRTEWSNPKAIKLTRLN